MSAPREPTLRLVKPSSPEAETAPRADARSPSASPALASTRGLGAVSGENTNDSNSSAVSLGATLPGIGVPDFHARHKPHATRPMLFVLPETVAAIAKVKRKNDDDTVVIDRSLFEAHTNPKPHTEEPAPSTDPRWHRFEDIGLAPHPLTKKAQKLVVSTYRLIGFGILSLIVAVLLGYIGTTAFYYLNHSWVTPVAISANDEKVVALQGQLASQLNEREKLVGELAEAERAIAAEQTFQTQFAKAIQRDLAGRRAALDRVQALASTAAATRDEIRTTNGNYSASTVSRMNEEYKAGMIDRDSMLAGKFQLAQISNANLSLAERQAEFDQRAAELAAQTQSLDAVLANKATVAALSYDVLKIARDYDASKLALAREMGNRARLTASIARQDKIISGIAESGYLRALGDNASVALVPYENLENLTPGTPLYSCRVAMLVCKQVGTVQEVLPGEVQLKHPKRDTILRGRMIAMQMSEPSAAQEEVLFAGGAPLGF
jgi:hypothetical protein